MRLGQGVGLAQILADLGHVAEGVTTTATVAKLANELGIDMPITQNVAELLAGNINPADTVQRLLSRTPKTEALD